MSANTSLPKIPKEGGPYTDPIPLHSSGSSLSHCDCQKLIYYLNNMQRRRGGPKGSTNKIPPVVHFYSGATEPTRSNKKTQQTFVSKFELLFYGDDDEARQVKFSLAQGCSVSARRHPLSVLAIVGSVAREYKKKKSNLARQVTKLEQDNANQIVDCRQQSHFVSSSSCNFVVSISRLIYRNKFLGKLTFICCSHMHKSSQVDGFLFALN